MGIQEALKHISFFKLTNSLAAIFTESERMAVVGGTLRLPALLEKTFTLTQSAAPGWASLQPLWAAHPNARYSTNFLPRDDFQLCPRYAGLAEVGFVRAREVLEGPAVPALCQHSPGTWTPRAEALAQPARAQWLRGLHFGAVSGQTSMPASLNCLGAVSTREVWNLRFLSFTWKFGSQREADPDCSWGYDPAGFAVQWAGRGVSWDESAHGGSVGTISFSHGWSLYG